MKTMAIVLAALSAGTNPIPPSALLVDDDVPDGFELAVEPPTDLTFDEYAPLSPDATAYLDPGSSAARSMRAAVDVWTSADDDILLREVTRWNSDAEARAFVEQAVVVGTEDGLDQVSPPFDGGVAFLGADEGLWTRTVAWRQGPYAMTIAHFAISEGTGRIIDVAADGLADRATETTGLPVAPSIPEGSTVETSETSSDGGIGVGTVLLWIVVIGGVMWLIARLRSRAAASPHQGRDRSGEKHREPADDRNDEPADVDDIIERARARSRAGREIDAIPDPTEPGRTPPDDD